MDVLVLQATNAGVRPGNEAREIHEVSIHSLPRQSEEGYV